MRNRLIENLNFYFIRAIEDSSKLDDFKNELLVCRKIINETWNHDLISDKMYIECGEIIEDYSMKCLKLVCK